MKADKILAQRVSALMKIHSLSQQALAKKARVGQKTISYLINERHSATLDTAEKIAKAFNLPLWALLEENIPPDSAKRIARLVKQYAEADSFGREHIDLIASRESAKEN